MTLYSVGFTGLTTRTKLMKEKEKVRFYAENEPSYLPIFFSPVFPLFKWFYCVNHLYINGVLRFSISRALWLRMELLKNRAEHSHPTPRALPGWCPVCGSMWKRIFLLIIFSINGKWHMQRWKLKRTMFSCASIQSHYICHNSLHNWLLIYFNTCVCSKWC